MGGSKNQKYDEFEQGWSFSSEHVCAGCVDDYALEAAIRAHEDPDEQCDFCEGSPAAKLDVLVAAFVSGLQAVYGDAHGEGVWYDDEEGYLVPTKDTWDLVDEFWEVFRDNQQLVEAVRDSIEDRAWFNRSSLETNYGEALDSAWKSFCHEVTFRTRYVFWLRGDSDQEEWAGEVPASKILDAIGDLIRMCGLVREVPAGHRFWRALPHGEQEVNWGAARIGTVPRNLAKQANRMSPAGIPMFYGAEDAETAIQESMIRTNLKWATAGAFELSEPFAVVDFTRLPPEPSMFDEEKRGIRESLSFLHDFVEQLQTPARETFEQVDYVPTQIVTEYLLRIFGRESPVMGLMYSSSLTGQPCVVLDVPNERCVDQAPAWEQNPHTLGLVPDSMKTWEITKAVHPA